MNPCENPDDDNQKEQIYNIENDILFTGYDIDYSMFKNGYMF
jgi:hypothetical protein